MARQPKFKVCAGPADKKGVAVIVHAVMHLKSAKRKDGVLTKAHIAGKFEDWHEGDNLTTAKYGNTLWVEHVESGEMLGLRRRLPGWNEGPHGGWAIIAEVGSKHEHAHELAAYIGAEQEPWEK